MIFAHSIKNFISVREISFTVEKCVNLPGSGGNGVFVSADLQSLRVLGYGPVIGAEAAAAARPRVADTSHTGKESGPERTLRTHAFTIWTVHQLGTPLKPPV